MQSNTDTTPLFVIATCEDKLKCSTGLIGNFCSETFMSAEGNAILGFGYVVVLNYLQGRLYIYL